jgi:hypothetical protein
MIFMRIISTLKKESWYFDITLIILTLFFDYLDIILRLDWHLLIESNKTRLHWHLLIESRQATSFIEFASRKKKKKLLFSKEKFSFSTFQFHEMKSIDIIFAFSIICFSVYIKSIRILLVLVLVVLDLDSDLDFVLVLALVIVLCLVLVLMQNQLDA